MMKQLTGYPTKFSEHSFFNETLGTESVVVDFGSNHGFFATAIIKRFGCHVYGVEPVKELFDALPKTQDGLFTAFNVAIGAVDGVQEINVFSDKCASLYGSNTADEYTQTGEVSVWTLRTFLEQANLLHVDLLKIDIEGAELDMLETANSDDLQRISQITIEFHDFIFVEQKDRVRTAINKLIDNGFYMIRISQDNTDVLFVNSAHCQIPMLKLAFIRGPYKYAIGIQRRLKRSLYNNSSN